MLTMFARVLRACLVVALTVAPVLAGAACTCSCSCSCSCPTGADVTTRHNQYRARHGVPGLKWSDAVADSAAAWSKRCVFEHESQSKYGENLYAVWGATNTTQALAGAVDSWYSEAKAYNYAKPGFSEKTGHFTQVVWKGSTRVGCSARRCGPMTIVVCRYDPPGNVLGQFAANVPRPVAE